ncbi:MAG: 50S ribosomal protein L17 [Candidatus Omnitrophota bacterium]
MRHRKLSRRLSRPLGARRATLRNLVIGLLKYQRIKTTRAKAKCAQPLAERLIILGKQNTLHARRQAFKLIHDKLAVELLFAQIAPLFHQKGSGFTRVIRYTVRPGDGAEMVFLELTEKSPKAVKAGKVPKEKEEKTAKQKPAKPEGKPAEKQKPFKEDRHTDSKEAKPKKFLGGLRTLFKKERDSL